MRDTTKALISHYVQQLDLSGQVLEIGGQRLDECAIDLFPAPRFAYRNMNPQASDIPDTITAEITDCRDAVSDESFDLVVSCDVFEHLDRPWLAANEIARILRPGGLAITNTLFAWRAQPGPHDYWRYAPESLEVLFDGLECLEKGYDQRDAEDQSVYLVGRKGSGPSVTRFQDSKHPLAAHLRPDIGEPAAGLFGSEGELPAAADPVEALRPTLIEISDRLAMLEKMVNERVDQLKVIDARSRRVERRIGQIDAIDARTRRLERRIDRAVASFPFRSMLRVRRGLHRMLK